MSNKLIKNVCHFYLTLAIPLLYLAVLYIIATTPDSVPPSLIFFDQLLNLPSARLISITIAFTGIVLWITSFYYLSSAFGVLPKKPKKIIKSGPYKYFSHPMYVAIFLTFTGLALVNLSFPGFMVNLLILTPVNWYRARKESAMIKP